MLASIQATEPCANDAALAPNVPPDRPVHVAAAKESQAAEALAAFKRHTAPAVKQVWSTLPQTRCRYLKGLPSSQAFFVTARINDLDGQLEQVFVHVCYWLGTQVSGEIANELNNVKTYRQGQPITFPGPAVLDWTTCPPDGTREDNYVGKLIEANNR